MPEARAHTPFFPAPSRPLSQPLSMNNFSSPGSAQRYLMLCTHQVKKGPASLLHAQDAWPRSQPESWIRKCLLPRHGVCQGEDERGHGEEERDGCRRSGVVPVSLDDVVADHEVDNQAGGIHERC